MTVAEQPILELEILGRVRNLVTLPHRTQHRRALGTPVIGSSGRRGIGSEGGSYGNHSPS